MIKLGCAVLIILSLATTALFYAAIRQLRGRDE